MSYRLCGLIPCYNNHLTVRDVAERLRNQIGEVIIVDDGSNEATREVLAELRDDGFRVLARPENGGKGAALKDGFQLAWDEGFTHALQVDADGQHDLSRASDFAARSRQRPEALLLGYPRFDETAPLARRLGRKITRFWTHIETIGPKIVDPMCGFRVYPLEPSLAANVHGDHMEFDIEIAVKMLRMGVPVENHEVHVEYLDEEEGGISHFRMFTDNVHISWAHTRLVISLIPWLLGRLRRRQLT